MFSSWGGRREGVGRKRQRPRSRVRRQETLRVLHEAFFAGMDRFGFRLVHFSVQTNHVHMIAEARGTRSPSACRASRSAWQRR
jgi:REP element-mobilizing transposase RayT